VSKANKKCLIRSISKFLPVYCHIVKGAENAEIQVIIMVKTFYSDEIGKFEDLAVKKSERA